MRVQFTSAVAVLVLAACGDPVLPTVANSSPRFAAGVGQAIRLDDQCDAETFNAAVGAGTCVTPNGGVTFSKFVALLTQTQSVGAWRITPTVLDVEEGTTLPVLNAGGEVHTFTEVEEFGGGIIPFLNDLSGAGDITPECAFLHGSDGLQPGTTVQHTFDEEGVEKYQCCIHPWMRQVVHVR